MFHTKKVEKYYCSIQVTDSIGHISHQKVRKVLQQKCLSYRQNWAHFPPKRQKTGIEGVSRLQTELGTFPTKKVRNCHWSIQVKDRIGHITHQKGRKILQQKCLGYRHNWANFPPKRQETVIIYPRSQRELGTFPTKKLGGNYQRSIFMYFSLRKQENILELSMLKTKSGIFPLKQQGF